MIERIVRLYADQGGSQYGSEVVSQLEHALQCAQLHVDAKRYLCHAEDGYWERLSPASKHSLVLQGGVYGSLEAAAFIVQPFAADAVRLRRWDDLAKVPGAPAPDLGEVARLLRDAFERNGAAIAGA